jgi:BASS family bile acid:Na+ symporter
MGTPEAFDRIGCHLPADVTPSMTENELFLYDIATKKVTPLTKDFDPSLDGGVDWSWADGKVYFRAECRDYVYLYQLNPKTGKIQQLPVTGDDVYRFDMAAHAPILAYLSYNTLEPASAYVVTLNSKLSTLNSKLFYEALLTCIIGPSASAAPVVVGKLGGNISTMTTYTLISSLASALLIPLVFPMLEPAAGITFMAAFLIILEKVSYVLLLPLVLGWMMQHYLKRLCAWIVSMPDLSFYCWAFSLSITTGITVKNIVHSTAPVMLLGLIAVATFVLCWIQFGIGRGIGRLLGEEVNSGQALFQKNTALSIWVAYMYLNPVSSIGAGCYVLWQNIINSFELWQYRKTSK